MKKSIIKKLLILGCFICNITTVPAQAILSETIVVDQHGKGQFTTVTDAINAIPHWKKTPTRIVIHNGIYKEKILLPETKGQISLIGENADSTVITYDDFSGRKTAFGEDVGTGGSATFYVYCNDFYAENITFANTAGQVGQAVAMLVASDKVHFRNCRFLGNQDTLCTWGKGRQLYEHCYIEGTVDFIFGPAMCLFDSCTIFCKAPGGFITAASTPEKQAFGYLFRNCHISGDAAAGSFYLGRPWRPFAKTVYLNCYLDKQINKEGWNNWDNKANEQTCYYAEYNSTGPAASKTQRVKWAHQLTIAEARACELLADFDDWKTTLPWDMPK